MKDKIYIKFPPQIQLLINIYNIYPSRGINIIYINQEVVSWGAPFGEERNYIKNC